MLKQIITLMCSFSLCFAAQQPLAIAPYDSQLKQAREALNSLDISAHFPYVQIVEKVPAGQRYGVCYDYAISRVLNIVGKIPSTLLLEGGSEWFSEYNFLDDYCQETTQPKKGDIVSYWCDPKSAIPAHLAVAYDEYFVESKWGEREVIYRHLTRYVPTVYGDEVRHHTLTMTIDEIIADLQRKIFHNLGRISERCDQINNWLLYAAAKGGIGDIYKLRFRTVTTYVLFREIVTELRRNMLIRVDVTNKGGQTPFIIAVQNKNFALAKLFHLYGANVNKQDAYGNTALHYAVDNNSTKIINYLASNGCSKKLKNIHGRTASFYQKTCPITKPLKSKRRTKKIKR